MRKNIIFITLLFFLMSGCESMKFEDAVLNANETEKEIFTEALTEQTTETTTYDPSVPKKQGLTVYSDSNAYEENVHADNGNNLFDEDEFRKKEMELAQKTMDDVKKYQNAGPDQGYGNGELVEDTLNAILLYTTAGKADAKFDLPEIKTKPIEPEVMNLKLGANISSELEDKARQVFSKRSIIDPKQMKRVLCDELEISYDEAQNVMDAFDIDWNEKAYRKARGKLYNLGVLKVNGVEVDFKQDEESEYNNTVDYVKSYGFTHEQAVYGVEKCMSEADTYKPVGSINVNVDGLDINSDGSIKTGE